MALIETLGLVSGDSHVTEPRNLWRDNTTRGTRTARGSRAHCATSAGSLKCGDHP